MSTLSAICTVATLSLLAFAFAAVALAGLRGTCSRACDRDGRPLCGRCPLRVDEAARAGPADVAPGEPR